MKDSERAALARTSAEAVLARCDALAACSEEEAALTRSFLSPPMREVHRLLRRWMEAAGMRVRVDGIGNLVGRLPSAHPAAKTLLVGSHLDTVRDAGRYDGVLGVLLGLAAAEQFRARPLPFHLEVIGFSDEEGLRFGVPFLGSKAVTGQLTPDLLELRDAQGSRVLDAVRAFGLNPATPGTVYAAEGLLGYLEVHIEQGPVLASLNAPLGLVSVIAGSSRARAGFTGQAGHAGTTPMPLRRDALTGAAQLALAAEALARASEGLVATVGQFEVQPGTINVIPGRVTLGLDVRHAEDALRQEAVRRLRAQAEAIASERQLGLEWQLLMDQAAVPLDSGLQNLLQEAAAGSLPVLPSGAGHDAMIMASLTPSAMLFVRSPNGLSHHPDEMVTLDDVARALGVLIAALERLAAASRA